MAFRLPRGFFTLFFTSMLCGIASAATAEQLAIAIDSGLEPAMADLSSIFMRKTGIRIAVNTDSSALRAESVENGSAYDVLLIADEDTAGSLVAMGLLDSGPQLFALGRLAVATATDYPLGNWQQWIRSSRIERIALPDPASSPHGREVLRALQALGLIEHVRDRLAPVSNATGLLAETAEGRASIAFLPAALLTGQPANVQAIELPPGSYRLLPHRVVLTATGAKRAPVASRQFADFLSSPHARDILRRHGYQLP